MICEITGAPLKFIETLLLVPDSQRALVESVLSECEVVGNHWSQSITEVSEYNDFNETGSTLMWTLSLRNKQDVNKVQLELDRLQ